MRGLAAIATVMVMAAAPAEDAALRRGAELTRLLLEGPAETLHGQLSPEFSKAVGGARGVARLTEQVRAQAGRELEVRRQAVFREAGTTHYYRLSRFEGLPDVTVEWIWDDGGVVVGGWIRPTVQPAPTEHLDYQTRAPLKLPFGPPRTGRWYVGWGGRDAMHNYHVVAADQRFAYDFYVVADRRPHRGEGKANEDYYCFGEPVLAPAAGRVVQVKDGVADNRPGEMNPREPAGNYVVIDHGEGEHSLIAHFRKSTISVAEGQTVAAGARLGQCGNSGNSSMAHVHYHLQRGPGFGKGVGLPAFFNGYVADGAPVARGEPLRGQTLEP